MDNLDVKTVYILVGTFWMIDGIESFSVDIQPRFQEVKKGSSHTITCIYTGFNIDDVLRIEVQWFKHVLADTGTIFKASNQTLKEDGFSENYADRTSFPDNLLPSHLEGSSIRFPEYGHNHSITFSEVKLTDSTNYSCDVQITFKESSDWVHGPDSPQSQIMIDGYGQPGIAMWRYNRTGHLVKYGDANEPMTVECLHSAVAQPTTFFRLYNGTKPIQCTAAFHIYGENVTHCTVMVLMTRYDNKKSEWRCVMEDGAYSAESSIMQIEVKFKAEEIHMIKKLPKNPEIGTFVETMCETPASNPSVIIEWLKDRTIILQTDQMNITRFEREGECNANRSYSILSFTVTKELTGSYFSCFVDQQPYLKSPETNIEHRVFIEGYYGPQLAGSELTLSCEVTYVLHEAKYRWRFVAAGEKEPMTIAREENYTKASTSPEDSGEYICESHVQRSTYSKTITVEIVELDVAAKNSDASGEYVTPANDIDRSTPPAKNRGCSTIANVSVVLYLYLYTMVLQGS